MKTGLILPVPEAEPVVGEARERHDAAAVGAPPHVTLIFPFRPMEAVDGTVLNWLESLFASTPAFELSFARLGRFKGVRWLRPSPRAPVDDLVARLVRAFPDCPPYEGAHGSRPEPHLTFAVGRDEEALDFVALAVKERMTEPIRAQIRAAALYALDEAGWREQARFPLAGRATI